MKRPPGAHWPAILVAVFLVAVLAYGSSLGNGFAYDDDSILLDNPRVTAPLGLTALFTEPYWKTRASGGLYRPITILTYRWNHALHGLKPFGYHLVNVLLHGVVTLLVALLAAALLGPGGALAAGLWFAVQPVHTEAVANVVGRAELLAALGVLLAAWFEPVAGGRPGAVGGAAPPLPVTPAAGPTLPAPVRRILAAVALGLGLFSKEVALAWLGVSLLRTWLLRRRFDFGLWAGYAVVTALYLTLRVAALGALAHPEEVVIYRLDNVIATLPQPAALWTALGVFGRYASLLVVPWRLSADYSWPMIDRAGLGEPWSWIGLAVAMVGIGFTVRGLLAGRSGAGVNASQAAAAPNPPTDVSGARGVPGPAVTLGLLLFAGTFFPISNFVLPIGTVMGERLLYLPSVGVALLVGALWERLMAGRRGPERTAILALGVFLVGAGVVHCWTRSRAWRDSFSIHAATVKTSPRSARAHFNYSAQLLIAGRSQESLGALEQAMTLDPSYTEAWVNMGNIQMSLGNVDRARGALRRALENDPDFYSALVSLGGVELRAGNPSAALPSLERAVRVDSAASEGWFNLGLARVGLGDTTAAVSALRRAVELNPSDVEGLNNLAWYLATASQFSDARAEAVKLAEAAVALRADASTLDTYSVALALVGRNRDSAAAGRRALQSGAENRAEIEARLQRLAAVPEGAVIARPW